jgi:hypothetical protein
LKIEWVTQEKGSNLYWEAWIGVKLEREREREVLSSRKVGSMCIQMNWVANVRNPSLQPGLGTGHVRCLALTRVRAEEPDMSGTRTGYVR